MKCFSLISQRYMLPASGESWERAYFRTDHYPTPIEGIALRPSDRALVVGWKDQISTATELLQAPADSGVVERHGDQVKLLRCSVKKSDGLWQFVPEDPADANCALVYLDISAGSHLNLRYEAKPEQVISRVRVDGGGVVDEKLLVKLRPFEPITAYRSDLRFWFFGEERVREVLTIQFDGSNIFYDHSHVE